MTHQKRTVTNNVDEVKILEDLIGFPSITPNDAGSAAYVESFLVKLGFKVRIEVIDSVTCLYAKHGNGHNFCFSGHLDVVPPGDIELWTNNPFQATIRDGFVYGRGAVDMKGGIAAFLSAIADIVINQKDIFKTKSISVLLTSDEEKAGVTSCGRFLKMLYEAGERIDSCLVCEPTCEKHLGDSVKIGRRGSATFTVNIDGVSGHVAYPELVKNPITDLAQYMYRIKSEPLDRGTKFFSPSNLEVVNINSDPSYTKDNTNIVPRNASAVFNIRFNDLHSFESLKQKMKDKCDNIIQLPHTINSIGGNKPFLSEDKQLGNLVKDYVAETLNTVCSFSTTGGTTDGSYISDFCKNLAEFGPLEETMHKIDERISIKDLNRLKKIYQKIATSF